MTTGWQEESLLSEPSEDVSSVFYVTEPCPAKMRKGNLVGG